MFFPVEGNKVHGLLKPATDAAGRTSRYVSLKNVVKAAIYVYINQAATDTVLLTPEQATAISGSPSPKALSANVPIWANQALATDDTMVRQTDAANFTTSAAQTEKLVCFEISPAQCMDIANGYDCLVIVTGASNAGNITAAWIECEMKYQQATPPSIVTD